MVNTNCRPAVVQIHKVSGTRETTKLDMINEQLQMTSAKATNDSCNDAQVNEEPPQKPLPPTNPGDDYSKFMKDSYKKPNPTSIEDFTNMVYYNNNLNQTIQFLIVVLFGSGAYALWRATK